MPRTTDRAARREQIVSAAAATFAQRGVANTAVSDIVRAAGVAQGTFYLYFASKDEVILAVAERFGDSMVDAIERAVERGDVPAPDKLLALRDVLGDSAALSGASDLVEILHREGNAAIHDRLSDHLAPRLVAVVERIVAQGVAEGVFDVPDVRAAAWFVLSGLRSAELSGASFEEMPAALTAATELALRALGYGREDTL
jgi:AcrR family transcriptional regulator